MVLARLTYNLILVVTLALSAPLWFAYMLVVPKTRAGFRQKLGFYSEALRQQLQSGDNRKRIWFHAVSVGEFNAIRPLIQELQADYRVIISTTTRTGQTLAQKTFPELAVLYFPFDLRPAVRSALKLVRPDLVVLTETELWPNFIDLVTKTRRTPLLLINGRISPRSFRGYGRIRLLIKPYLKRFTHLYMQSQGDADRIQALSGMPPERLTVAGNLKFDLVPTVNPMQRDILSHLLNVSDGDTVLTLASTHMGEDAPLIEAVLALRKDFPELKVILAPRHPERLGEIRGILNSQALQYSVRSQLSNEHPNDAPLVVLDSIGELLTVYSMSTVAVMGGSFVDKGGQNPLEPLSQRVPVIFGPYMYNFPEISGMILEQQAGTQVQNTGGIIPAVTQLLTQPEIYDTVAENGQQLVENNRGAKGILLQAIRHHIGRK